MKNLEIARIFNNIADLLEIKGDNPFKIRAYRRAALNLESIAEDLANISVRGDLREIPGIGKDLSQKIEEYLRIGSMSYYEELKREIPESLLDLMAIQGVGPKKAKLFHEALGIKASMNSKRWQSLTTSGPPWNQGKNRREYPPGHCSLPARG